MITMAVGQLTAVGSTKIDIGFRYKTSYALMDAQYIHYNALSGRSKGHESNVHVRCNRASKFDPRLSFRVIDFSLPTSPLPPPPPPPPSSSSSYS